MKYQKTLCMKYLYSTISLTVILFFSFLSNAQVDFNQIASNRTIQKYRNENQLRKINEADPIRLQTIYSYFTSTFTYTVTTGEEISIETLTNIYHFDVNEFEFLRQANAPHSFIFKEKFVITLQSISDLNALLNGYELPSLLNSLPLRPFPTFINSGNLEQDFQSYKEKVWDWARDFPNEYQALTSSESVKHIRFSDYLQMNEEKRTTVTQGNYLFID